MNENLGFIKRTIIGSAIALLVAFALWVCCVCLSESITFFTMEQRFAWLAVFWFIVVLLKTLQGGGFFDELLFENWGVALLFFVFWILSSLIAAGCDWMFHAGIRLSEHWFFWVVVFCMGLVFGNVKQEFWLSLSFGEADS